jgi:hypothetical protein
MATPNVRMDWKIGPAKPTARPIPAPSSSRPARVEPRYTLGVSGDHPVGEV